MALLSVPAGPSRALAVVDGESTAAFQALLSDALDGVGPALFPVPPGWSDQLAPLPEAVRSDIALVIETSGSTSSPKRVALSAEALIASADATHDALGGPGRWLLALPAHYIAGAQVLVRSIRAGTEPIVVAGQTFDARAFAEAAALLDARTPRYTSLVPTQLTRVVEAGERDAFVAAAVTSFDAVLVGGQALDPTLAARAEALGARLVRTYGSSETSGGCVYDGRPLDGVEVRAVDGRIELAGPMLATEYLGDERRTASAFVIDRGRRWYRTDDLGEFSNGELRISGRSDDVIISGGVKVSLGEVETIVRASPGFGDAVVVAIDHAEWGQVPAVIAVRGSESEPPDALDAAIARIATVIGPAGRPAVVHLVDEMPLLASGKPDRRALRSLVSL